ncbi:MAG TPA: ComF family protein [Marmoricola sp.]|jgi:predicted amidophosphoribosyltransferase|nr:ComF family protein [Marmoricola sp.]
MRDAWFDLALGGTCTACGTPGRRLCRACEAALPATGFAIRPDPVPLGLVPSYAAAPYADPLRALLIAHKEDRAFGLAVPLGRVLAAVVGDALDDVLAGAPGLAGASLVLVPIPSSRAAVRARGHDPVLRMTQAAAAKLRGEGLDVRAAPLLRQRPGVRDQAGLDAGSRAENLAGSLAIMHGGHRRLRGRTVLIVVCDDVITTGSSAREAQRALAASGLPPALVATVAATRRRLGRAANQDFGSLPLCPGEG